MEVRHGPRVSAALFPEKKPSVPQNGEIVGLNRGLDALEEGTASFIWNELNHYPRWPALKPNHYADNAVHVP